MFPKGVIRVRALVPRLWASVALYGGCLICSIILGVGMKKFGGGVFSMPTPVQNRVPPKTQIGGDFRAISPPHRPTPGGDWGAPRLHAHRLWTPRTACGRRKRRNETQKTHKNWFFMIKRECELRRISENNGIPPPPPTTPGSPQKARSNRVVFF